MSKKRNHNWQRVSCPECQGTGIKNYRQFAEYGIETSYADCERCKGSGQINQSKDEDSHARRPTDRR